MAQIFNPYLKKHVFMQGINLLRGLLLQPVVVANDVARIIGVSYTKANTLIATCEKLGILRQSS
jgi:hypothetical protein